MSELLSLPAAGLLERWLALQLRAGGLERQAKAVEASGLRLDEVIPGVQLQSLWRIATAAAS